MKFFTSRYTASLEQQIAELRGDKARLQMQLDAALALVKDPVRYHEVGLEQASHEQAGTKQEKKSPPTPVNWLRGRAQIERQDVVVREADPEKEKSANGTR